MCLLNYQHVLQEAVHLNPGDEELRRDDLEWAVGLLRQRDARVQEAGSCDDITSDGKIGNDRNNSS